MKILAVGITFAVLASSTFAVGEVKTPKTPVPTGPGTSHTSSLYQEVRALESWYPVGEQVTVVYTIRNSGTSTLTYNFSSGKQHDIWITSGGQEVYRLSRGRMYSQALTQITLKPGESKEFRTDWNQKDLQGKPVSSGWFTVHAQLMPTGSNPYAASSRIWIGDPQLVVVPMVISVADAVRRAGELNGKSVVITATYKGWNADSISSNLASGPPVTRSDWIIADSTGSLYVSGKTDLDPERSVGARVQVTGKLARTSTGQVYLLAESTQIIR